MRFPVPVAPVLSNVDPLLPVDPAPLPVPLDPAPNRRAKIVCESCECELTPAGDALKISDKFRSFRTLGDKIDTLKAELERVQIALTTAERERDEARAQLPKRSAIWG